jgi:hypothetical protein
MILDAAELPYADVNAAHPTAPGKPDAAGRRELMKFMVFCCATLACCCSISHAADLHVHSGVCANAARFVARDEPLSSVLKRLADSLGFELVYQSLRDPLISVDQRSPLIDLIREIAQGTNFSVEQVTDGRCMNVVRVTKVFVLPDKGGTTPVPVVKRDAYAAEVERVAPQVLIGYLKSHEMDDQTIAATVK